jgi:hypothetical protein
MALAARATAANRISKGKVGVRLVSTTLLAGNDKSGTGK